MEQRFVSLDGIHAIAVVQIIIKEPSGKTVPPLESAAAAGFPDIQFDEVQPATVVLGVAQKLVDRLHASESLTVLCGSMV